MKTISKFLVGSNQSLSRIGAIVLCAGLCGGASLRAGEAASPAGKNVTPAEEEPDNFSNWINLGIGGLISGGDKAQFNQQHAIGDGPVMGGIEDMHLEYTLAKKVVVKLDARAIFDNNDYKVQLEISKQDLGYIRAGYTQFRTWYDGNGGFFPAVHPGNSPSSPPIHPGGMFFDPTHSEMSLDRGDIWVELGLQIPKLPELILRYDHLYRNGQKDSTSWGSSYNTGLSTSPTSALNQRKFVPSFRDINEQSEVFTGDIKQTLFGNTDLNLGMRYEYTHNTDALNMHNRPGEPAQKAVPVDLYVTQVDTIHSNLFSGHILSETRFNEKIWFTLGYSYTTIDSDTGGNRITGPEGFYPPFAVNKTYMSGFINMAGESQSSQHVINLNLMLNPLPDFVAILASRMNLSQIDSDNNWVNTSTRVTPNVSNYHGNSSNNVNTFAESLDLRYTGIENIVLYARGEWQEQEGTLQDAIFNLSGSTPNLNIIDDGISSLSNTSQKYAVGANWYPLRQVNFAVQYYYKNAGNSYEYAHEPGILGKMQVNTNDVNLRVTSRPMNNVVIVSRYDYLNTTVDTQSPGLDWLQSSVNKVHMFTENVTWNPLARLYVQGDYAYVINETDTPAGNIVATGSTSSTPTTFKGTPVTNFSNNYWTTGASVGFLIDDKTDIRAQYSFYNANNYVNNATVGMPYGSSATSQEVSATLSRRITKNVSMSLKYSYYKYTDLTSGDHNNYDAHVFYSGVNICF